MDNGQVLGECLYQIIPLMTSAATNAKIHIGWFIQPVAISANYKSTEYQALVFIMRSVSFFFSQVMKKIYKQIKTTNKN